MTVLRVAIVGCGKIADQHVLALKRIPNARIVGVCDREELMAEQLAERYSIGCFSSDVDHLLDKMKPDVVHITTPPSSHFPLAVRCLDAGSHVYVEKPFTLDTNEAVTLIRLAEDRGLKLTAGHNYQYTLENIEARRLVRAGFLGGPPVHIESYYTYNLGDAGYAKALLGDKDHWVRRLPGGLLQNIISHGIARIAEFMIAEGPAVFAFGYTGPLLQGIGETEIIDELRVYITDGRNTTASFLFSSQFSPPLNEFRIYGPKNSLIVDNMHRTLIRLKNKGYKSYLNYTIPSLESAADHLRNFAKNTSRFLRMRFHDDSGMKNLIEAFYRSISGEGPLPISYREIILTSKIMDAVFEQLRKRGALDLEIAL
jgi:predicted dehydrogenase